MNRSDRSGSVAVLEDDAVYRDDILVPALRAHGFNVESFGRPSELYRRLLVASFDVIVLDVGLPDEDGLSVARHLRAGSPLGIVMLTGRHDMTEQIQGLQETADAWLLKPVDADLVAAVVGSLLRRIRMNPVPPAALAAQTPAPRTWRLNYDTWRLHCPRDRPISLTHPERRILAELFSARGETVARDQLIASLAAVPEAFDPHRLEMMIHRLRRKVMGQLGEALPLQTVRGRGYVLIAEQASA